MKRWNTPDARVLHIVLVEDNDEENFPRPVLRIQDDARCPEMRPLMIAQQSQLDRLLQSKAADLNNEHGQVRFLCIELTLVTPFLSMQLHIGLPLLGMNLSELRHGRCCQPEPFCILKFI